MLNPWSMVVYLYKGHKFQVLVVLLLGASLEALAATRDLVPGSRVTLSLRNPSQQQEEEEPDYTEEADSDLDLDKLELGKLEYVR